MSYLLSFIAIVVAATCALTPPIYGLVLSILPQDPWPFSRVFDRVLLAVLLVGLFVARKRLSLAVLKPYFFRDRVALRTRDLTVGVLISLLSSCLLLSLIVGDELHWVGRSWGAVAGRLPKLLVSALLIGLIEEAIFRVLLFGKLASAFPLALSASLASVLYALVHFIAPDKSFVFSPGDMLLGFEYLASVLERGLDLQLLPAMAGLFLVGLVLCFSLLRTRAVYLGIGLHAGWVMAVKLTGFLTEAAPGVNFGNDLLRRYFLVARPEAWVSFLLVTVIIYFYTQARCARTSD